MKTNLYIIILMQHVNLIIDNKLLKKEGFHDIIVRKDFRGKYRMVKATKK